MLEAGILDEDERVELIEGEISTMAAKSVKHSAGVSAPVSVWKAVRRARSSGLEDPIHLDDYSEPEPDVIVAARRARLSTRIITRLLPELLLVVEVAESGLPTGSKMPLYARAGIAQYWILNSARS